MPRPGSEPPLADRWLAERAALMEGGPAQRMVARGDRQEIDVAGGPPKPGQKGYLFDVLMDELLGDRYPARPPVRRVEVALYPLGSVAGDLPLVIALFADEGVVEALEAQDGEADVRGDVAPGRGLVLVLDDGTTVGCVGPASPPPAVLARRRYGLR